MTEAKKMIFFADDLKIQAFGWNKNPGHFVSTQKEMSGQALSMMFWVKQNEIDTSKYDGFFTLIKGQTGNLYGFSSGIQESTGYINAVQQNIATINTDYKLQSNIWTHLAYTRDATGTIIKIYINGQLAKTQVVRAQAGLPNTIVIGDDNGYILAKDIAKLSIYCSELTQEEIQSEVKNVNAISRKNDLFALFVDGVHGGSLIDFCGNYNIMCNDRIENRGAFKL